MYHKILESWPVGVLSTYGTRGIDSVPIVFVLVDDVLYSPIDNKPKSGKRLARIRNVERDPRYTLLLQHYDDDWSALWWLKVQGGATVLEVGHAHHDVLGALAAKYSQYRETGLLEGTSTLLRLGIGRHVAWAFQGKDWLARQFR